MLSIPKKLPMAFTDLGSPRKCISWTENKKIVGGLQYHIGRRGTGREEYLDPETEFFSCFLKHICSSFILDSVFCSEKVEIIAKVTSGIVIIYKALGRQKKWRVSGKAASDGSIAHIFKISRNNKLISWDLNADFAGS